MKRSQITQLPEKFEPKTDFGKQSGRASQTFQFELITPMFGGDADSWQLDTKNPVRAQSVKGSLRFWWRTLQNEDDINKLLNAENSLWGGNTANGEGKDQSIKSPVSIAILNQKEIETELIQTNESGKGGKRLGKNCIPNYVLFPVTEEVTKQNKNISVIKKLSFELLVSYPENRKV
jgi:CRISPR-associated protein Cmr1